jgi:hypothetical protein
MNEESVESKEKNVQEKEKVLTPEERFRIVLKKRKLKKNI